ncbi:hypothetical protein [Arenimonas sp.]|uniref:hypothetical protein n=1 Tax=Arenimonas sp. TaxID=1872635 RepID=UPI0025BBE9AA|nr:hypothetical protein [Arenimonas sp.]
MVIEGMPEVVVGQELKDGFSEFQRLGSNAAGLEALGPPSDAERQGVNAKFTWVAVSRRTATLSGCGLPEASTHNVIQRVIEVSVTDGEIESCLVKTFQFIGEDSDPDFEVDQPVNERIESCAEYRSE